MTRFAFIRQIGDSYVVSTSENPNGFVYKARPVRGMSPPKQRAEDYLHALRRYGYSIEFRAGA
jgi:hypothetical protein